MAKISIWKVIGLIGTLSEEVSKAMEDDGKVDTIEMLSIGTETAKKLDLPIDEKHENMIKFLAAIGGDVIEACEDGKVTITEIIDIVDNLCEKFGIDLVIHPEKEACTEIVRLVEHPYATRVMDFEGGRLKMIGIIRLF